MTEKGVASPYACVLGIAMETEEQKQEKWDGHIPEWSNAEWTKKDPARLIHKHPWLRESRLQRRR